jgi:uncharacterized membrane protein YhaH (DUF805 family)
MFLPYQRYFDFSGRSRRMEYWMFTLFYGGFLILVAAVTAMQSLGANLDETFDSNSAQIDSAQVPSSFGALETILVILLVLYVFGSIIPAIAVQVRRFHDQDRSGWFILLNFIPYIGGLIVLVMMCLDGTPGSNRFGPDPKGRDGSYS